jgi:hypothetical protein
MNKLTLSVDAELVEKAKQIARERGTNVSAMFSQYIEMLVRQKQQEQAPSLPPITRSAVGVAKLPDGESYKTAIAKAVADRYK